MIKNKISNKPWVQPVVSAVLAASLAVSPLTALAAMSLSPMAVFAAEPTTAQTSANSTEPQNNTATTNDLNQSDIFDGSKTGSLTIHKYDITAAEAANDYTEGQIKATGESDTRVENALKDYAIQGVQFTYLKVGEIETYSNTKADGTDIKLVYEVPERLAEILKLNPADATDMTEPTLSHRCGNTGVYHYTSSQLTNALSAILEADEIGAKNDLEEYLYDYKTQDSNQDGSTKIGATNMPKTDANGVTTVDGLPLGLYLLVETEVPEEVTSTVNPWFVSLPFTNTAADADNGVHDPNGVTNSGNATGTEANLSGGELWLYDMVCYPKNQTGNPTLDKSVRNAYSNTARTDKNGSIDVGTAYVSSNASDSLIVRNDDSNNDDFAMDTSDSAYVANRGGYTADGITAGKDGAGYSKDFEYRDTTTASEGDILDYILVSKLPHITSKATYLSEYTFTDVLGKGISYNHDAKIALYRTAEDANANNTKNAVEIWNLASGKYGHEYASVTVQDPSTGSTTSDGSTRMIVRMTESGLAQINGTSNSTTGTQNGEQWQEKDGYSDYYMVVYYTATVESSDEVVLGDNGNVNDVQLLWSRTSYDYSNSLQDRNYVYTYGLDLLKTFSDNDDNHANAKNVQFKLYNRTDAYYVIAEQNPEDGLYYVTGKTVSEADATTFVPAANGQLYVNGLEADTYQLTEVATDDGYTLLKDQITIDITATDREIIASVAGTTGLDSAAADAIVANYGTGIKNENGQLVTEASSEFAGDAAVAGPTDETANGRTIGKTDMYVGQIHAASATVDKVSATMINGSARTGDIASANAIVKMSVVNNKGFLLPKTGGSGLYLITILGVLAVGCGCYCMSRKSKKANA